MREVYIVRPYVDGPNEAFRNYSTAYLRKCELDKEYGGSAVLETLKFEDDKLLPSRLPEYGPSGVRMFGGQAIRRSNA